MNHIKTRGRYTYLLLVFLMITDPNTAMAQSCGVWQNAGSAGFSDGAIGEVSIAVNNRGIAYVVYKDSGNNNRAIVKKYDNGTWVGGPASTNEISGPRIATDTAGYVYIITKETDNGALYSYKYNGTAWAFTGAVVVTRTVSNYSIAIARDGTPYVSYKDDGVNGKATVRKYSGSEWTTVGMTGFSAGSVNNTQLAINNDGTPYITFRDANSSHKITVMKYDANSWITVGNAGFSTGAAKDPDIAIDNTGNAYVCYCDDGEGGKVVVKKYDGNSWVTMGEQFGNSAEQTSMAINSSGSVFVSYSENSNAGKATVKTYKNGTWENVGATGFTTGDVSSLCMANDMDVIYVAYKDMANANKVSVKKISKQLPPITGPEAVCKDQSELYSNILAGGTWKTAYPNWISSSGLFTGSSPGTANISYTMGECEATTTITINPLPGKISGIVSIPVAGTTVLSCTPEGGKWSSSAKGIATIDAMTGVVTGLKKDTATITYKLTDTRCYSRQTVTVTK